MKFMKFSDNFFTGSGIKAALWAAVFFAACGAAEGAGPFRVEVGEEPYIGCEVTLTLSGVETRMPGTVYEWSVKGNAQAILFRKGGMECSFVPHDKKPITASVAALDSAGAELARSEISLTAKDIHVGIVQVEAEPFMLWDAIGKKDVEAGGLVAKEPFQFRFYLTPEYKKSLRIRWETDASTAILDGGDETQVTVVRNDIGDSEIAVTISDAKGLVLGRGSLSVNVPVSRSKVDESDRRRKAWKQWMTALSQWEAKNFDAAVENAKAAGETDPENLELTDGVRVMLANRVRVERARKLAAEAASLRNNEGKPVEALKIYRRSYAAWPIEEVEKIIGGLESEIDAMRIKAQKVEWLRDTATSYDQENLFARALVFYKEALTLVSHDAIAQRIGRIEKRLESMERARVLTEAGRELEARGRFQDALDTYRESLKIEASAEVGGHARELEEVIRKRQSRAASLRKEGADFQKKNDNTRALLRYLESLALWPDAETEKRVADLKKTVGDPSPKNIRSSEDFGIGTRADAVRLLRRGHDLYSEGKYREALDFYRRSYAISEDKPLKNWIERVESPLKEYEAVEKANALIKEGNTLYNSGRFAEALEKYKASLLSHSNVEVENFVKKLESALKSAKASASAVKQ
jgi:tetratricopeptide (TPR) repeat protein